MNDEVVAGDQNPDQTDTGKDQSAQTDNLDKVLAEIDKEFEQDTQVPAESGDRLEQLEERVASLQSLNVEQAIQASVNTIKDTMETKVPDKAIRGWLNEEANQDPRIRKAFQESNTNPTAWNKILKSIAQNISKEFGSQPDPDVNGSREAITAAMRGQSTVTADDEAPKFESMTDAEFAAWKMKVG